MPKHRNARGRFFACAGRAALAHVAAIAPWLLAGCSGDVVSLGERQDELAVPSHSRCQSSTTLEGAVRVASQEQLDALEGCEVIAGDLDIIAFPAASLRPLHALARVEGYVKVGGHTPLERGYEPSPDGWMSDLEAYEASIVDWLPSLEGLERLESVNSLSLTAPVSSLLPLSGLRRINAGSLNVSSDLLESLAGLEGAGSLEAVALQGAELRDIGAVHFRESMSGLLIHAPIAELDASELKSADRIDLGYTELENLDGLAKLESAGSILLTGNQQLRDLSGLAGLRSVGELVVSENDALERMGDFDSLQELDSLVIRDNDRLTELPSFPSYYLDETPVPPEIGADWRHFRNIERIELRGNDSLRRFAMHDKWRTATYVTIASTAVESIDFARLESIGTLLLEANPQLADVELGALSVVAYLGLRDNHVLPAGAFDGVRTVESPIGESAPAP